MIDDAKHVQHHCIRYTSIHTSSCTHISKSAVVLSDKEVILLSPCSHKTHVNSPYTS